LQTVAWCNASVMKQQQSSNTDGAKLNVLLSVTNMENYSEVLIFRILGARRIKPLLYNMRYNVTAVNESDGVSA